MAPSHVGTISQKHIIKNIQNEELTIMRLGAQNFIRNKLEPINFESVEYLAPILGSLKQDLFPFFCY